MFTVAVENFQNFQEETLIFFMRIFNFSCALKNYKRFWNDICTMTTARVKHLQKRLRKGQWQIKR